MVVANKTKKSAPKKAMHRFVLDCTVPAADNVLDLATFKKFLHDRIKINGKTGVLGESIDIQNTKDMLRINAHIDISKRYLKYLTKKYLKKQQLRDFIRVIASDKSTYKLKYFNLHAEDNAE